MMAAPWRKRWVETSLALRIAAAVVLFGLVVAGAAAASAYWALSRQLDVRLENELDGKRLLLLHLLSEMPDVEAIASYGHRFGDLLIGHKDLHLAVVDPSAERLLAGFSKVAAESVALVQSDTLGSSIRWRTDNGNRYASLAGMAPVQNGQNVRYVVTIDLKDDQSLLRDFGRAAALGLPLLLALVALGAWAVARTGLAPLNRLTAMASRVTTHTLAERIDARGLPTELSTLAHALNAMLERIDAGVQRLSEFSADLAHEMRTPVATLLGRTQVALSRPRSVEGLHEVLVANVEELDRLTRLIADMLFLAQADQGAAPLERTAIDLAQEVRRVAEFLSVVAEERGVRVELSGEGSVQGDRMLVQRAITNLLTNAIRHSESPGVVSFTLREHGNATQLDVCNRGPGISAAQFGRVFERFVRLDAARTRTDGGTGLGLAIVKSVMQAHGGSVDVVSSGGVTTFSLRFAPQKTPTFAVDKPHFG